MPSPSTFALFALTALALLVVPGPAVLYIVTRSINQGRRAGLVSVAGIHTGSIVHVVAAALGVSAILASSSAAFTVVKLLGAAYLVVLGVLRLTTRRQRSPDEPAPPGASMRRIYAHGIVVNVLNPKTALFFLAFLPQFVNPARGPVASQIVVLGICFIGLGLCSDATYAVVASSLRHRLRLGDRFAHKRDRLSGVVYIGLGATAALAGHPARRPAT